MKVVDSFSGEFLFLSNFSAHSFTDKHGNFWKTNEHYYQAHKMVYGKCKTIIKEDGTKELITWRDYVRQSKNAAVSKQRGREGPLRPDFEDVKQRIMYEGLKMKFDQHPDIKEKLIATGDKELVEGNYWGDVIWGVCNGKGQNLLGKLLMRLREEYKNE